MPKFSPSPETPTALDSAANCSPKKTAPPATETPTKGSTFKSCLGVQVQELLTAARQVRIRDDFAHKLSTQLVRQRCHRDRETAGGTDDAATQICSGPEQ